MEFERMLEIILEKGFIAILLLIVGLWVNRLLESYKSLLEQKRNTKLIIAQSRLPAFSSLWDLTAPTSPTKIVELTEVERQKLESNLRDWYYTNGNGMYLSSELRNTYLAARERLRAGDDFAKNFSKLRSDLKDEIGIYGSFNDN